ncbi:hypothetical protein POM88_022827 [Heracleum sosnowskyi]|uniref:Myb/SANT-like domain-containing protein n=1 Tax=Heracleum sosnowskyi TaxID=360622 RepID=A0AAD8IIL7_9APIA|nr:hypothetical protein POM88_022827 [Heracleum sosnowskyi]
MRRQYNFIKNLLELDGLVWDDTRKMVTADDCVWQDYIKVREKREDDSVPIEIVIEAIQALPDMDQEHVLDACDLLEDDKKGKTFFSFGYRITEEVADQEAQG